MYIAWKLSDWRDFSTIVGVIIALCVYVTNTLSEFKQRKIENLMRFYSVHHKLFENPFLEKNIEAMERGTFRRDPANRDMEKHFNRLLGEIEHIAWLQNVKAIPPKINVYMFGWFARQIQPMLTAEERNNPYWELAVCFLDATKKAADDFYKKTQEARARYFKRDGYAS